MAALAGRLLDGMAADGPPADLLARFATPFPYTVICGVLGVPTGDLGLLLPWVSAMMSAGHHPDTEVKAAHEGMRGYFAEQVAARRTLPGDDLLTELVHRSDLSAEEITVFGSGLLMAGGETTSNFLAMCVLDLASRPELAARLRADPSLIPPAVEEYLRWVWFAGTGGHPHVVLADTELVSTPLTRGDVVVPLTDAANRDPAAFHAADDFNPARSPNPHLGFGHGRHKCLGAHHARAQLQIALTALLTRFDDLTLAMDPAHLLARPNVHPRHLATPHHLAQKPPR